MQMPMHGGERKSLVIDDRAITDKASELKWLARCQVWVERNTEYANRLWKAEDQGKVTRRLVAEGEALEREMRRAGLDGADMDYVVRLSLKARPGLSHKKPKAKRRRTPSS